MRLRFLSSSMMQRKFSRERILKAISEWDEPLTKKEHQDGTLIIALYVDLNVAWDSNNDFLLARLLGLILGHGLRAHPNP
eukprot:6943813-Pyramimonas_sp.AAC.1